LHLSGLSVGYRGETLRLPSPAQVSFAKGVSVDELKIGVREGGVRPQGAGSRPRSTCRASLSHVKADLVKHVMPGASSPAVASGAGSVLQGIVSSPTGSVKADVDDLRFADARRDRIAAFNCMPRAHLADDTAALTPS